MATFTAFTTVSGRVLAEKLAVAFERLVPAPMAVGVFDVEDGSGQWGVGGYFSQAPDVAGLALLAAAFGAERFVVSELPKTDWVAHVKRQLSPVRAGRFFVYGSHDADKVPTRSVGLLIEAAMAFGTGHHGTTLGCLRALDRLLGQGVVARRVADIGCGTAVLAIAAARCFEAAVIASDIDPVAVAVAQANAAANGLQDRVNCVEAAGFAHPDLAVGGFDLIFANILKRPLVKLAPAMTHAASPGAKLILSGILSTQAAEIVSVYAAIGWKLVCSEVIVDWSTLTLEKNRS